MHYPLSFRRFPRRTNNLYPVRRREVVVLGNSSDSNDTLSIPWWVVIIIVFLFSGFAMYMLKVK